MKASRVAVMLSLVQGLLLVPCGKGEIVLSRLPWTGRTFSVAVAGNHAYLGAPGHLVVIDISAPTHPLPVAKAAVPAAVENLCLRNKLVFAAVGKAGLLVFKSTNGALKELAHYEAGHHVWGVTLGNRHAYLAAHDSGVRIIDIANPTAPREVGWLETPGLALAASVSGKYLYVADGLRLRIATLSRGTRPKEVAFVPTPGPALKVAVARGYAFVATYNFGVRIIDVSAPESPKEAGFFDTPGLALSVAVRGRFLYVADGPSGLRIIDVADPRTPKEVGFLQTPGFAEDVALSENLALVADTEDLRLIDITDPTNPRELSAFDPRREIDTQAFAAPVEWPATAIGSCCPSLQPATR